ncbi:MULTISPECIES: glutathione S-transferase [Pseudomonas]|uniref:Glutathione S-transferase 2 n=1 Tax=Pseudomonas fluorescens (strain Q2-87) TaxID=1038922 RepID=J2MN02_PSEFQ|nr:MULTISPECIES: glutathione S-transferase [Pseudomonas]EJL02282.1 glutathione S-transferase 2 [Pseudomonas fluorescens Q2-87]
MKVYDIPGFPNPLRVRIVLAEKGLGAHVDFIKIDLPAAEHKQPAFLAINPLGTVPVLELDDGTYICECTAITEYLDNLDGNPILTGKTPKQKAIIHMMQKRAESELADPVGFYFHHATPGLGAALQPYKSPEWEGRVEWGNRQRDKAVNGMRYFDQVLRGQPYIAGEQFSMADITVLAGLIFAGFASIAIPEECTALTGWQAKIQERPSVKHPA